MVEKETKKQKEKEEEENPMIMPRDGVSTYFLRYNPKTNAWGVNIDISAEVIENKYDIRTIYGLRDEILELYDKGIWEKKGKGIIKSSVEELLKSYSKNNSVSEILEKIKRRTEVSREEADNIPDFKRCIANGVLVLEHPGHVILVEHSKKYNFRNKFPMNYDPDAKCPNIDKFIKETFYEEDIPLVYEWFGFHLARRYFLKKALIAHGPKNTGKTVFLNLLATFLGNNVSGLSLQEISYGKPFDLMALKDKDGNICDDLSSADMKAVGGFKMAVGDGFINGEMKFGDKCRFRNTAKDTNACNKIPSPGEDIDDEAYYERIILLPIDNVVLDKEQDRNLIDKLTTPEELSGLLNLAIEGYKRLVKQNGFSNPKTPEETKFLMVQNGNSLARFAEEVLKEEDGGIIDKETMYMVYCNWCRKHKPQLSPATKDKIGKTLMKFVTYIHASHSGQKRTWVNVKVIKEELLTGGTPFKITQGDIYKKKIVDSNKSDTYVFSKPVPPVRDNIPKTEEKIEVETTKISNSQGLPNGDLAGVLRPLTSAPVEIIKSKTEEEEKAIKLKIIEQNKEVLKDIEDPVLKKEIEELTKNNIPTEEEEKAEFFKKMAEEGY